MTNIKRNVSAKVQRFNAAAKVNSSPKTIEQSRNNLRALRKAQGWSTLELYRKMGYKPTPAMKAQGYVKAIQAWERGDCVPQTQPYRALHGIFGDILRVERRVNTMKVV